jgi:spermidine synthase
MSHSLGSLVHKEYWNGHSVEIRDNGDHRSLYFDSENLQSRMSIARPQDLVLSYTWHMVSALLMVPEPHDILIVGIGAGSLVRFFSHHFPGSRIDAVDSSSHIIHLAKGFFRLPENDRIVVHCRGGLRFLQESREKRYDLILVDAFDHQGMAPSVYSEPFFSRCSESLKSTGVVSCNLWSSDALYYRQIQAILADLFAGCLYLPVPGRGNIVALTMKEIVPWSRILLKSKELAKLSNHYGIDFKELVGTAKANNLSLSERFLSFLHPAGTKK